VNSVGFLLILVGEKSLDLQVDWFFEFVAWVVDKKAIDKLLVFNWWEEVDAVAVVEVKLAADWCALWMGGIDWKIDGIWCHWLYIQFVEIVSFVFSFSWGFDFEEKLMIWAEVEAHCQLKIWLKGSAQ
jgi:hypothetical protein